MTEREGTIFRAIELSRGARGSFDHSDGRSAAARAGRGRAIIAQAKAGESLSEAGTRIDTMSGAILGLWFSPYPANH